MVCCCDRKVCEWLLRIGNAMAALLGLLLLGCGLYLVFGPVTASNNLLEFLKLDKVPQSYGLLTRFPIVVVCIGAAIFLLSAITFCITGTSCAKVSRPQSHSFRSRTSHSFTTTTPSLSHRHTHFPLTY